MIGLLGRKILVSGCENVFGRLTALKLANLGAEVRFIYSGKGGQLKLHSPDFFTISTDDLYEDAVDSIIKVIYNKPSNQVVNIAGNEYISLWHLANIIKQHFNNECCIKTTNNVLLDEMECCLDSVKARELLDFTLRLI